MTIVGYWIYPTLQTLTLTLTLEPLPIYPLSTIEIQNSNLVSLRSEILVMRLSYEAYSPTETGWNDLKILGTVEMLKV